MNKEHWYQKRKLKHITGFLTKEKKEALQRIAKKKSDLTLTRYISRLLEKHIRENSK